MEAVPSPIENEKPVTTTKWQKFPVDIWAKWTIATAVGMVAELSLAAIPGISELDLGTTDYSGVGGPIFKFTGFRLVILFFAMGLLSALPQTWIISKIVKRSYLWLIATGVGALIGGIFASEWTDVAWINYPFVTIIPISIAQGIALGILFGWLRGIIWPILNFLTKSFFSLFVGLMVAMFFPRPFVEAILFGVGIGLPCGFLTGLYIAITVKFANKSLKLIEVASAA